MRFSSTMLCASLLAVGMLLAQGPPGHAFGGPGLRGFGGHGGVPITGAPYSATITDTRQETLADGNVIQQTHTGKVDRDADGRTRSEFEMTTPSGSTKTIITIVDPVAGFVAHLNPTDSTAMKQLLRSHPQHTMKTRPTPPADANGPEVVKTDLGTSTIAGLAATGTRTTRTIPAGAIGNAQAIVETREAWVSTALKMPIQVTHTDPRRGTTSMTMSNITQSAPDATLFQIPSSYTVKDSAASRHPGEPRGDVRGNGGPPPFEE